MRVANGVPFRSQIVKLLSTTGLAYIGYGIIGFLLVVLWIPAKVGWFSAILVLAPLFVARWAFVQYGDELRAHERTLDALVSAVEAKDPPSTGHSARVAQLSEWIAESLSMGHTEVDDVRTAGMLHDLGKLALPSQIVRMPRQHSDDEQVRFAEHPQHAVQMLGSIDFLRGSLDGIAHHHERFDGHGYPAGLAGDEIPLAARIIAVADAFDALTTVQPHRAALTPAEAMAELERRAGTHVDPHVVAALSRALGRHSWSPTVRTADVLAAAGVSIDHDDPQVSDLLAGRADLRQRIAQAGPALPNLASTGRST
jgi:putative nucleotidyltransferase with HDIG domain